MIKEVVQVGEPQEHRGIVVTPLFPMSDPVAIYAPLDEALERGLRITEVSDSGSVPELTVENPLEERVLLYDGEELIGAKQNRILNISVLVEAKSSLRVPVSCVEQGRWSRRSAHFGAARHSASPALRRSKNLALHDAPLMLGRSQDAVWRTVYENAERLDVHSPTGASADTFRAHAGSLAELEGAFRPEPGQCGAVLALGSFVCVDLVSRPDAFRTLWPKLRRGYMLDALERLDGEPATLEQVTAFLGATSAAHPTRRSSVGLGQDFRLDGEGVLGSGLEFDREVIQLSAFSNYETSQAFGRLASPSQRR